METIGRLNTARTRLVRATLALAVVAAGMLMADGPARAGWDHWERIEFVDAFAETDDLPPQQEYFYLQYDGGATAPHPALRNPASVGQAWHFVPQPGPGRPDNLYQIRGLGNRCMTLVGDRVRMRECGSGWAYIWQRREDASGAYVLASTVNGFCLHYARWWWSGARFPVTSSSVVMDSVSDCNGSTSDRGFRYRLST
jgi:hypothetical protein